MTPAWRLDALSLVRQCLTRLSFPSAERRIVVLGIATSSDRSSNFDPTSAMWEPLGNAPVNNEPYWKSASKERETFTIFSSCLITLTLCVYTSLHLNVPKQGVPYWRCQFWKRAWWVVLGVAAPEYVMSGGQAQDVEMGNRRPSIPHVNISGISGSFGPRHQSIMSRSERRIKAKWRAVLHGPREARPADRDRRQPSQRYHNWTRTHSYFALMGGFVLNNSKMSINPFDDGRKCSTITTSTLRAITRAMPYSIPDISKETILDKSKANGIGKLLLCMQVCWFGAQPTGRLATNDHPSVCLSSTCCSTHSVSCLFLAFGGSSPWTSKSPTTSMYRRPGPTPCTRRCVQTGGCIRVNACWHDLHCNKSKKKIRLYSRQRCFGFHLVVEAKDPSGVYFELKWADLECLRLAHGSLSEQLGNDPYTDIKNFPLHEMFVDHVSTLNATDESLKRLKATATRDESAEALWNLDRVATAGFMAAAAVYGGLHLLAWDVPSLTIEEQWRWRIASMIIASPIVAVPICLLFRRGVSALISPYSGNASVARSCLTLCIAYLAARFYIMVECFVHLAHLPPGVYNVPAWSRFLPHLSAG
ncbi:uncharacterized protein M421DRAFT_90173 [Didymella exigua CBS 183.55]|uniref:Uncharacterized protein n=1 Tax=Didymella exigua CBS 183.55 TaxID=1150837 RepID=A0A6A5RXP3_9PLEO|nr:uncharacterized protein M421DRAFT_90173 [Didymella exigua CBS 183.55]KAF1931066.1 hypothetical protein M421DRAFT_90173 [Didymella exigua CBS 183.55]